MTKIFQLWDKQKKQIVEVVATKRAKEWRALCPNHPDQKHPNLDINEEKQVYLCRACGWTGHLYNPNYQAGKTKMEGSMKKNAETVKSIYEEMGKQAEGFAKNLNDDFRMFLKEARGLTSEVIRHYKLGFAKSHPKYGGGERLTIPVWKNGRIVNLRFHSFKDENPKDYPYDSDLPSAISLYPEDQLKSDKVWLCEGEPDALCAISHGLNALTVTGGAGSWKNEFTPLFKGKMVNIVYDCDPAGRQGARKIAEILVRVAEKVKVIDLGLKEGADLTDYFQEQTREQVKELADVTPAEKKMKPSKSKFNPRLYSLEVLSNNFLKYDEFKRFWIYDKTMGIWRDKGELILNSNLRKKILGDKDYKRYCVGEIIADLQGLTWMEEIPEEPEPYLVPFKNKIYHLKNDKLLNYSPDCFFINKLATDINEENKECPTIDKILRELVDAEDLVTLFEIPAYCLYRGYPYPKIFILYGSGGNGKGVYIRILTKLLGKGNISLVTSTDLQSNRFASSQLFGKLLNVSGEMDYAILKKTSMMKRCCGEDLINCERKFREPFPFTNYAKMVFSTNQVPLTSDKTYAFYRRIFLLEFPNKFILGENADPMIVNKIPEKEFEGLAWKCLEKAKELYNKGFVFTNHERTEEVTKKYEDLSNPLNKFLEESTLEDIDGDIAVGDFNERYLSYLKEKNFRAWSEKEINKVMKDKGFTQKTLHTTEDGRDTTHRAWLGLIWK